MEIEFKGGKFVSSHGELNYLEVLKDFPSAKTIRIITYNISKNTKTDKLLEALRDTTADVQIITNIPSRMPFYTSSKKGQNMRMQAKDNIQVYIQKLNPEHFPRNFASFFNVENHAKLIGTENIVYIGSANYSNESASNIESGVIIQDTAFIQQLYSSFFNHTRDISESYIEETFNILRLLILSLHSKFKYHYHTLLENVYTNYMENTVLTSGDVFIEISYLENLYLDLEELDSVCYTAKETMDDADSEYNAELNQFIKRFNSLDTVWLKDTISEGGTLYNLVSFDQDSEIDSILQNKYSHCAYDEYLDVYVQKSIDEAAAMFSALHDSFEEDASQFIQEIEKILSALDFADRFINKWISAHINPDIDNT